MVRVSGGDRPKLSSRPPIAVLARFRLDYPLPPTSLLVEAALGYGQSDAVATPAAAELQPKAEGYMAATREAG